MARKKKKRKFRIHVSKRTCLIITNTIVVLGLILLIVNRTIPKEPDHSIYFHNSTGDIYVNEEKQFGYTIVNYAENDNLIWSTSNSNIATVNEKGVVKGISFGDVVISVRLNNDDYSEMKIRVKSYDVSFTMNVDEKLTNGWHNTPISVYFKYKNIDDLKYCISLEKCEPNINYKEKINLANGIWNIYVSGIDKNNKVFEFNNYYKIDTIAPQCTISRINKMDSLDGTISVVCLEDASGIDKYEWYRDNERLFITDNMQIYAKDIYALGKHNYYVEVFDKAGNSVKYNVI